MPIEDARQRRARVRFGEQSLEDIASDGRRRRVLSAVSTVAYGLGTLGIFYRAQLFDGEPLPEPVGLNYLVIGSIGIQSIVSVIGALSTSQDAFPRPALSARAADAARHRERDGVTALSGRRGGRGERVGRGAPDARAPQGPAGGSRTAE